MIETSHPELEEVIAAIGAAGARLSEIEASEGAAGNISVYLGWRIEPRRLFPCVTSISLPQAVPELAGDAFLVTGSGRRLRDVLARPGENLGCVVVEEGGVRGQLYTAPQAQFSRLTSEFNSHLAVHYDQIKATRTTFHAIVHAQPPYLTYLSHIPAYQEAHYLNQHILRWQPELIIQFPEGIGWVPFCVPGSAQLMEQTTREMRAHRLVLWGKHGVMSRSASSLDHATDRIEYIEAGARYEYMNCVNHDMGEGLTPEEVRAVCVALGIQQNLF